MSKRGAIVSGLVVIAGALSLSACHINDHGGGMVYRPHHRTVQNGPVETRTTTVAPYYRNYRYVRYRRDRHGRYHRHPHGEYYLAHDGRYYRHSDIRYRRDRYGRFHRDTRGEYYLARDGRYYNARDGHHVETRRGLYDGAPSPVTRQPGIMSNRRRTDPPAHGLHDTQPGHLKNRPGSGSRPKAAYGNPGIRAGEHSRRGASAQPPAPASRGMPSRDHVRDPAPSRTRSMTSAPPRGRSLPDTKQSKGSANFRPASAKQSKHPETGKGNGRQKDMEPVPDEAGGKNRS